MLSFYLQLSHSRKGQVNQSELACSAQVTLPALRLLTAPYKWHYCCLAAKSCPVLFDPLDRSSPVSPAQSRILEWVATPSSKESSRSRDGTHISCLLHWQVHSLPLAPAYFSKIKSQNKNQPTKKTKTIEKLKSQEKKADWLMTWRMTWQWVLWALFVFFCFVFCLVGFCSVYARLCGRNQQPGNTHNPRKTPFPPAKDLDKICCV